MIANTLPLPAYLDTVLTLPRDVRGYAIASACREAGLTFVNESEWWGKGELATWLLGPYGAVTQYSSDAVGRDAVGPRRHLSLMPSVDATRVAELLRAARLEVRSVLESLFESDGAASFAFGMLASGYVERFEDSLGSVGWVPTRRAQRIADRALSLFAADYLTRPGDYEMDLSVCKLCKTVSFDASAKFRGACDRHDGELLVPDSHVVPVPQVRATRPYAPDVDGRKAA